MSGIAESPTVDRIAIGVTLVAVSLTLVLLLGEHGAARLWWRSMQERRANHAAVVSAASDLQSLSEAVTLGDHSRRDAMTVYEFFDYECPFCLESEDSVRALFPSQTALVLRRVQFPLPIHAASRRAAAAALCAASFGRGAAMHTELVRDSSWHHDSSFQKAAVAAGIPDNEAFWRCLVDSTIQVRIDKSIALAAFLHIQATPTFVSSKGRHVGLLNSAGMAELK